MAHPGNTVCLSCRLGLPLSKRGLRVTGLSRHFSQRLPSSSSSSSLSFLSCLANTRTELTIEDVRAYARYFSSSTTRRQSPIVDSRIEHDPLEPAVQPERDSRDLVARAERASLEPTTQAQHVSQDLTTETEPASLEFITLNPELAAQLARQQYGDSLPRDLLSVEEYQVYKRLYGQPIWLEAPEQLLDGVEQDIRVDGDEQEPLSDPSEEDSLARGLESDPLHDGVQQKFIEVVSENVHDDVKVRGRARRDYKATLQLAKDFKTALGRDNGCEPEEEEVMEEEDDMEEAEENSEDEYGSSAEGLPRSHPLTRAGRFTTSPATLRLPREELIDPVMELLRNSSNKHITQIAHRELGGPGLPFSPATPLSGRTLPQTPIKLQASQTKMGKIEGDVFLAAIMPGTYAALTSTLVEVRKRLGSQWLRDLLRRKGGPRVLDVGAGGAGVVAWRQILKAEWRSMRAEDGSMSVEVPLGSSTIVTGSDVLRDSASQFLENSTFLPRLPDYLHATPDVLNGVDPARRKQYDVILAPHTLWPIFRPHLRKFHVQNLWSLLDPNGGVLVLLEKGLPKGFEAIAGARQMLLDRRYIPRSPGSEEIVSVEEAIEDRDDLWQQEPDESQKGGMIIAPCTNHTDCPMFNRHHHPSTTSVTGTKNVKGQQAKVLRPGRKELCHFSQRYVRPAYLQRILGAKDRNHEDVKFSYLAVRRGRDDRQEAGLVQGDVARDASFAGYEHSSTSTTGLALTSSSFSSQDDQVMTSTTMTTTKMKTDDDNLNMLTLPRTILPPLKRQGHVHLDVCTPAGHIERWTVPRSFSKQAYRDARKCQWGDLWALGAKTREGRMNRRREGADAADSAHHGHDPTSKDNANANANVGAPVNRKNKRRARREAKIEQQKIMEGG